MRATEPKVYHSKLSANCRTVIPRAVRYRLDISPGDRLRFLIDDGAVRIEKDVGAREDGGLATFSEWSSEADEEAFADL